MIKTVPNKPTATIILSGEKVKAFSVRGSIRQDVDFHHFYSLFLAVRKETAIKGLQIGESNYCCLHMM